MESTPLGGGFTPGVKIKMEIKKKNQVSTSRDEALKQPDQNKKNTEKIINTLFSPPAPPPLPPAAALSLEGNQAASSPPPLHPAPSHLSHTLVPCGSQFIQLPSWVSFSSVLAHWGDRWGPACSGSGCPHSFSPYNFHFFTPGYSSCCCFLHSIHSSRLFLPPSVKRSESTSLLSGPHSLAVWSAEQGGGGEGGEWSGRGRRERGRGGREEGAQWCCYGSSCHQCLSRNLAWRNQNSHRTRMKTRTHTHTHTHTQQPHVCLWAASSVLAHFLIVIPFKTTINPEQQDKGKHWFKFNTVTDDSKTGSNIIVTVTWCSKTM